MSNSNTICLGNVSENSEENVKISIDAIKLDRFSDPKELFEPLLNLANAFYDIGEETPKYTKYCKPITQLTNIEPFMNIIHEDCLQPLVDSLKYIDYSWFVVSSAARKLDVHDMKINSQFFDKLPIRYYWNYFGYIAKNNMDKPTKWVSLYQTCFSRSSFRHACKKAAKMTFLYYRILGDLKIYNDLINENDVKYILGAIQYAIYVRNYMNENHNEIMSYVGYVVTLSTFFDSFKDTFKEDEWETTVIPSKLVFFYPRRMDNIDNLSKVNDFIVKRYFDLYDKCLFEDAAKIIEELTLKQLNNFEMHCYKYPQCNVNEEYNEKILFYDPHYINHDDESSKMFINVIKDLRSMNNSIKYREIMESLNQLDSFEIMFLKRDTKSYVYMPMSFNNSKVAQRHVDSIQIPERFKDYDIRFVMMMETVNYKQGSIERYYDLKLFKQNI